MSEAGRAAPRLLALALAATSAAFGGCGHRGMRAVAPESIEAAYLQARMSMAGCPENDGACCAERAGAARAAAAAGETARAAQLWQGVALACPASRDEAGMAVLAASRLGPGPAAPGARVLNVSYRARLSPAVRLYWVAAVAGDRLLPVSDPAATATQPVRIEVQAIRFVGGRPGPLITAVRQFELPFDPGTTVTVEIAEGGGGGPAPDALSIQAQVDRVPAPRAPAPAAPTGPVRHTPDLEKARPLHMDPPRAPGEFGARLQGVRPALRLCLDRRGQLDTVRFLEQAHPRLAASMLDMLRDSEHTPYRVGDLPVPSCETTGRS
jgi:hypothetical protein